MRNTLFTVIILISMAPDSNAQADSGSKGTLTAYVVPLVWIDNNPRLRLGLEYHAHNHMGYSIEVGWGNKNLNHATLEEGVWGAEYSFFEVRPGIKWYKKEEKGFNLYLGAEWFYQSMTDRLDNDYFYPKDSPLTVYYDQAGFKKIKIGGLAKAGIKLLAWKKVMVDIYEGVGLAYRQNTYTNLANAIVSEDSPFEEWWIAPYKNEGAYLLIQISLGMRIGFVIGKIK